MDSHSPKYQKFKIDKLPLILNVEPWDYKDFMVHLKWRYPDGKPITPIKRSSEYYIYDDCKCSRCNAPKIYLYKNNGSEGQCQCKVCKTLFSPEENRHTSMKLRYPYCTHTLVPRKDRKHFIVHICVNSKCPYYMNNLKKVDNEDLETPYGQNSAYIMSLYITMHVNLSLSLRKTSQAIKDLYDISVSHQMVANYCRTAVLRIKPFVDTYPYEKGTVFTADETYIKVHGIKGFIWFIMDVASRAIIGYQVSDNRGVGPCIMAMRMAFQHLRELPKNFRFIADAHSAYPLAAQQFLIHYWNSFEFDITQVLGLTNDDVASAEFRPYKQVIERINRTYKEFYQPTNGFDNYNGGNHNLALWVEYYIFLMPHQHNGFKPPIVYDMVMNAVNMPGKW